MRAADRLSVLTETKETIVLRIHGQQVAATPQTGRGVVVYVRAGATATTVASQLRKAADKLDKPARKRKTAA